MLSCCVVHTVDTGLHWLLRLHDLQLCRHVAVSAPPYSQLSLTELLFSERSVLAIEGSEKVNRSVNRIRGLLKAR